MRDILYASLLIVTLYVPSVLAAAQDTITWIQWDDPPIFIFSGPFKGTGVLDNTQKILISHLPQYKHTTIEGSVPRVLKEAEKKTSICNAGWLDTAEWRKVFIFSKPAFMIPSNGILIKQSKLDGIKDLQPYSLQKFLDKRTQWKLGVGRLYGEGIDDVLEKNHYQKHPRIILISSSLKVHQMLQSDRIQYTIGYPFEAMYYNKLLKTKDPIVHLPLTDNNRFVNVVAACPKTPWGQKVITDINKVLQDPKVLEQITKGVDLWLSAEDRNRLIEPRSHR